MVECLRLLVFGYFSNQKTYTTFYLLLFRHRVSRCSFEINVCRSIQYSAEVSRSTLCEDRDTMNINVTVQNLNHPSDDFVAVISLVQMSLASNKWKLQEKAVLSTGKRISH